MSPCPYNASALDIRHPRGRRLVTPTSQRIRPTVLRDAAHRDDRCAPRRRTLTVHPEPADRPPAAGGVRPDDRAAVRALLGPGGGDSHAARPPGPIARGRPALPRRRRLGEPRPYVERLRELRATWPAGIVAHHYLRYLGDLSGGQIIARLVRRAYGLEDEGVRFYRFDRIADVDAFKAEYRLRLDAAPWDVDERARLVEEVNLGYRFAREMFDGLGEAVGAPAPG